MVRPAVPRPVPLAALLALCVVLAGCQGRPGPAGGDAGAPPPGGELTLPDGTPDRAPSPSSRVVETARPSVEPGAYAEDARTRDLLAAWPDHVGRAVEAVRARVGLEFPAGVVPYVQLEPLGDEDLPWRIEARVEDGRRVPFLRVNLERLAVGREAPEAAASRALVAAIFDDAGQRFGRMDAWVVRAGEIAAANVFDPSMQRLLRRRVEEGAGALAVDAGDPALVESTALAALLVLRSTGLADATARFFRFTAEGDDPDLMLAREVRDPLGSWTGEGRTLLEATMARLDPTPWQGLRRAREALEALGRAGLEAELTSAVMAAAPGETAWLRARAAADEGDLEAARAVFRAVPPAAWGAVPVLADALELWARIEDEPGGDPARAATLRRRWILDFPRRARASGLGPGAGTDAAAAMGIVEVRAHVARLLADHRAGAARRVLTSLGERAMAPELEGVRRAVAVEEETPGEANLAANAQRVLAWFRRAGEATASDVRDGGTAAARALARRLPAQPGVTRRAALILLAETAELGVVVGLVAPTWSGVAGRLRADLDTLLAVAPYAEVHLWAEGLAAEPVRRAGGDGLWSALRFGLSPGFVQGHPGILARLRDPDYAVRREAFDEAVRDGGGTPELVGRALADRATLLRRAAATAAGRAGFVALLQTALRDEAWVVRQAAAASVPGTYEGAAAVGVLRPLLRDDPSAPVRVAAARAMLESGGDTREVVDELIGRLPVEEPGVRTELLAALEALPKEQVIAATARGLRREVSAPQPRADVLALLFRLFRQAAGWEAGYVPGMSREELERTVTRVEDVARRVTTGLPR